MKSLFVASTVITSLGLMWAAPARAESPGDLANPRVTKRSWVNDHAGVLDAQTERKINDLLTPLYRKTGAEVAVATVDNLGGKSVEDFANDLFKRWKIGKRGDNGVLLLVAVRDRKMRIETGYGAEAQITDAQAKEITGTIIKPAFKRGDYNGGIYNGTYAIARRFDSALPARQNSQAPATSPKPKVAAPNNNSSDSPLRVPNESSPSEVPFGAPNYGQPAPSSGGGALILMLLVLGGGGVIALSALGSRPPRCPRCKGAMELVPENQEDPYLTDVQQLEESLGGREWNVWRCPRDSYIALMPHEKMFSGVGTCPNCQNRTATSNTQTLQYSTEFQNGLQQTTHICHNPACRYSWTTQQVTPRQMPVVIVTGGGFGSNSGGFDSGSSSSSGGFDSGSSSGSYDSGPSDFGGGDSGGGGASDSW